MEYFAIDLRYGGITNRAWRGGPCYDIGTRSSVRISRHAAGNETWKRLLPR